MLVANRLLKNKSKAAQPLQRASAGTAHFKTGGSGWCFPIARKTSANQLGCLSLRLYPLQNLHHYLIGRFVVGDDGHLCHASI